MDKPIIFSGPMVRAILDGQKTQTRQVMRPGRYDDSLRGHEPSGRVVNYYGDERLGAEYVRPGYSSVVLPMLYAVGDRLWVREAWRFDDAEMNSVTPAALPEQPELVLYEADRLFFDDDDRRRRSPIHMPRWASRITLRVTDVRVQRVQEISWIDAVAEGAHDPRRAMMRIDPDTGCVAAFRDLWNSINAKRGYGWDVNPWVVALTFERESR